ncbi:hypothetical protein AURDEDRAFT_113447 [Auricularia subglabra TFB-10046 SS5]|nr:hypothetical protein AURDEDRAFT_113447 [Auricularia subglabra TFB-10046 SS5]
MAYRARSSRPRRSDTSGSSSSRSGDTTDQNTPPCVFWLNGYCRRVGDCTFRHDSPFAIHLPTRDARADQPCRYFIGGRCAKGPTCPYKHQFPVAELDIPELFPPGLPIPAAAAVVPATAMVAELPAGNRKAPRQKPSEASLSSHRPADLLQRVIRGAINVTFGPGLEVVELALPSDPVPVTLSDLPPNVRKKELMKVLREHGDPVSLEVHRRPKRPPIATATYATHAAAAKAAKELDGLYLDTAIISAAAPAPAAGPASQRTTAVKLVWDQPTHNAVLGYRSSEFAHRKAMAINGRSFDGVRLAAFYQDERQPSVVIPDLPFSADPEALRALGRADNITFTAPSYQMGPARTALQALLSKHGPLESFYILPHLPGDNKVRAVACFTRSEHLEAAMSALHGTRQACVAASRVWFHRAYSIKYSIPAAHFAVIKERINQLRIDQRTFTSLRVIEPTAGSSQKDVILQMQTEDPAHVARLKAAVESITNGQVLRDADGRILWDTSFFSGDACRLFLQSLNDEGKVYVTSDPKQRRLNICGPPNDIADASKRILWRYGAYRDDRRTVTICDQSFRHFAKGGLSALQATLGKDNIHLNIADRLLVFRCSDEEVANVRRVANHISHGRSGLAEKRSRKGKQSNGAVCPVCRSEVTELVHLPCGHDYCAPCLQLCLVSSSSSEARVFPLQCIAPSSLPMPPGLPIKRPPTCDAPVPVSVIRRLLQPDEETALLDASFTAHVYAHPGVYKFCPTPDCDQVYHVAPPGAPSVFTCPGCLASTCTACHSAHPGLTCARHRSSLVAHTHRPDAIKRCPSGCGALLQKQDGCNHVQCPICKVHMCWICLQMFPNGGVYEHISSVHGEGFMPGVLPDDMLLL